MTVVLVFLIVVALGCLGGVWLGKRGEKARFTPPWTLPPDWDPPTTKEKSRQFLAELRSRLDQEAEKSRQLLLVEQWSRRNQEAEAPEEEEPIVMLYTEYAKLVKLHGPTPTCPICGRRPVDIHTRGFFGHEEDYDLCSRVP
jgi:hypothetical protein